jgi:peptide/nickel transport system ATP-binding protein
MIIAGYNVTKYFISGGMFSRNKVIVKAVQDVNIKISEGETLALVGESGSGKTTLGRLLVGLEKPTKGVILFNIPDKALEEYENAKDEETKRRIEKEYGINTKEFRRQVNMVFQDPYSSLDPRMKVLDIIKEPMIATNYLKGEEANKRVMELLEIVGLPRNFAYRYPHELSGGQRQRVAIARAISTNPKFIVLDEPTSALDVSTQAQILNMLRRLKKEMKISMLLITHNIAVASYLSDKIYVMYAGRIVEKGSKEQIMKNPKHPYTIALLSAVPKIGTKMQRIILKGEPPNLVDLPKGCNFHPRCPYAFEDCGWTSREVAEDLKYLIESRYYDLVGDVIIDIINDRELIVRGIEEQVLKKIINEEKEVRSFKGISKIEKKGNEILIIMRQFIEPEMYKIDDGREVRCLLFK